MFNLLGRLVVTRLSAPLRNPGGGIKARVAINSNEISGGDEPADFVGISNIHYNSNRTRVQTAYIY